MIGNQHKALDDIFSRCVREAADWRCACGCGRRMAHADRANLHCAHIRPRRFLATRWLPRNAVALFAKCHAFFTDHPKEFEVWATDMLGGPTQGPLAFAELRALSETIYKPTRPDLDLIRADLELQHQTLLQQRAQGIRGPLKLTSPYPTCR